MHTPSALKSVLESANPRMDSEDASGCPWSTARATAPSLGRPTPGAVKKDKSSGGSVDTTKTRSGPRRVRMSSGERPIGAAKGKQSDTQALCQPPPPPPLPGDRHLAQKALEILGAEGARGRPVLQVPSETPLPLKITNHEIPPTTNGLQRDALEGGEGGLAGTPPPPRVLLWSPLKGRGGRGGLAGTPRPPRVLLWSPPKAGQKISSVNPLGAKKKDFVEVILEFGGETVIW